MIALGVIRKPHGVSGEASVEPWTNDAERFEEIKRATLVSPDETKTRDVTISSVRVHGGRVLVAFDGIGTPEEVRDFANWTIEIPDEEARKLEADEYFLHDLVGMQLVDGDGNARGEVIDAYEGGGGVLLKVRHSGGEFEMPFAADLCTSIDVAAKRIVVNLPEGLDEI
ncbi:MAG TPA: ribosome maturation factor RimM [Thermoanaerobaculia bacterium]